MLRARAGIALGDAKRELVYGRLVRRARELGLDGIGAYLDAAEADPGEAERFTNALTTNLTSFFREPHHFDALAAFARRHGRERLRVWCGAASTGEECWSIAMTLATEGVAFDVLASDLDTDVLARARAGMYPLAAAASVPLRHRRWLQRGHGAHAGTIRIGPELRAAVSFAQVNLVDARWPLHGPFDAIFLRNVMIYFEQKDKSAVVARALNVLADDGILITGHAETQFGESALVRPVGPTVYRKR